MAIRVQHSASPGAVGMAAYATGLGRARERQKKQMLDVAQQQQQIQARRDAQQQEFGYRTWLEGQRQGATDQRILQDQTFRAEESKLGRQQQTDMATDRARMASEGEDLDFFKTQAEDIRSRIDAIGKDTGGVFQGDDDGVVASRWKTRNKVEMAVEDDLNHDGKFSPAERYQAQIKAGQSFLEAYKPDIHRVPDEKRDDYERVSPDGKLQRKNREGGYDDLGWAPDSKLTPEFIAARAAQEEANLKRDDKGNITGQWVRDSRTGERKLEPYTGGQGGQTPADRMAAEVKNRKLAQSYMESEDGFDETDVDANKKRLKEIMLELEGDGAGPGAGPAPAPAAGGAPAPARPQAVLPPGITLPDPFGAAQGAPAGPGAPVEQPAGPAAPGQPEVDAGFGGRGGIPPNRPGEYASRGRQGSIIRLYAPPGTPIQAMMLIQPEGESDEAFAERHRRLGYTEVSVEPGDGNQQPGQQQGPVGADPQQFPQLRARQQEAEAASQQQAQPATPQERVFRNAQMKMVARKLRMGIITPAQAAQILQQPTGGAAQGQQERPPGTPSQANPQEFAPAGRSAAEETSQLAQVEGRPVKPPGGKASKALQKKGYEYVAVLDSKGRENGQNAWRKKPQQSDMAASRSPASGQLGVAAAPKVDPRDAALMEKLRLDMEKNRLGMKQLGLGGAPAAQQFTPDQDAWIARAKVAHANGDPKATAFLKKLGLL